VSQPPKKQCVALYKFQGQQEGDLSFSVNSVITVLSQEGAWWHGELNGVRGLFPSNYVKLVEPETKGYLQEEEAEVERMKKYMEDQVKHLRDSFQQALEQAESINNNHQPSHEDLQELL